MILPSQPVVTPATVYLPCFDPFNSVEDGWQVSIETGMLEHLRDNGPKKKYLDAMLIPEAIEAPALVFEGLGRIGCTNGLCYCKAPSERWIDEGVKGKPPPLKVLLVYILPDKDQRKIVDWEWRCVDLQRPTHPVRWSTDFTRQVWPTTC